MKLGNHIKFFFENLYLKFKYSKKGIAITKVEIDLSKKVDFLDNICWHLYQPDCSRAYMEEQMKFLDDCYNNLDAFLEGETTDYKHDILLSLASVLSEVHKRLNDHVIEFSFDTLMKEFKERKLWLLG